jgi:hypothetical protein
MGTTARLWAVQSAARSSERGRPHLPPMEARRMHRGTVRPTVAAVMLVACAFLVAVYILGVTGRLTALRRLHFFRMAKG